MGVSAEKDEKPDFGEIAEAIARYVLLVLVDEDERDEQGRPYFDDMSMTDFQFVADALVSIALLETDRTFPAFHSFVCPPEQFRERANEFKDGRVCYWYLAMVLVGLFEHQFGDADAGRTIDVSYRHGYPRTKLYAEASKCGLICLERLGFAAREEATGLHRWTERVKEFEVCQWPKAKCSWSCGERRLRLLKDRHPTTPSTTLREFMTIDSNDLHALDRAIASLPPERVLDGFSLKRIRNVLEQFEMGTQEPTDRET